MSDQPKPPAFRNPDTAPFIYFDNAPVFGILAGAVQIEVASRVILPDETGTITEFVVTAHLRCSPLAAAELRNAIDKSLEMLQAPSGAPEGASVN